MNINELIEQVEDDGNGGDDGLIPNSRQDGGLKLCSAEGIVKELRKQSRSLFYWGYGIPQLVFTDGSFVAKTDWLLLAEVEGLLVGGHQPLGIIAPVREERGKPYIRSWQVGGEDATEALKDAAQLLYGHRMYQH